MQNKISKATIVRLPQYYNCIEEMLTQGIDHISSSALAKKMDITASLVRQDFNVLGLFGQQGYGYPTQKIYLKIKDLMGINCHHHIIIVGTGNLGQALVINNHFEKYGFHIVGLFDVNPRLIGLEISGIKIQSIDNLEEFIKKNRITMAVLTVPENCAKKIGKQMVDAGIKAIWNFSHTDLNLPEKITVENICLSDSLMKLSFRFHLQNVS